MCVCAYVFGRESKDMCGTEKRNEIEVGEREEKVREVEVHRKRNKRGKCSGVLPE